MYHTDDLLHRVDRIYLGPPGKTLPFKVRYVAYGVGFLVFVLSTVLLRGLLSVPWSSGSTLIQAGIVVFVTGRLMRFVTGDVTVRSVITAAWNDLVAPRPPKAGTSTPVAALPEARMRHLRNDAEDSASVSIDNDIWSVAA